MITSIFSTTAGPLTVPSVQLIHNLESESQLTFLYKNKLSVKAPCIHMMLVIYVIE